VRRHLHPSEIAAALRRGTSVEQFLGASPAETGRIRYIELRPTPGSIDLWLYELEDEGSEEALDIYGFPYVEPDGPQDPIAHFDDAQSALSGAHALVSADPERWANQGVGASDYLDYVLAGRPDCWPGAVAEPGRI
jgi:hypothetical protein